MDISDKHHLHLTYYSEVLSRCFHISHTSCMSSAFFCAPVNVFCQRLLSPPPPTAIWHHGIQYYNLQNTIKIHSIHHQNTISHYWKSVHEIEEYEQENVFVYNTRSINTWEIIIELIFILKANYLMTLILSNLKKMFPPILCKYVITASAAFTSLPCRLWKAFPSLLFSLVYYFSKYFPDHTLLET